MSDGDGVDIWAGTSEQEPPAEPVDTQLARMFAHEAFALERAASELRSAAGDDDQGDRARAKADGIERQANRLWDKAEAIREAKSKR